MLKVRLHVDFLIKRCINDIVFLLESKKTANKIIKDLKDTFENNNLKITSSIMSTDN